MNALVNCASIDRLNVSNKIICPKSYVHVFQQNMFQKIFICIDCILIIRVHSIGSTGTRGLPSSSYMCETIKSVLS